MERLLRSAGLMVRSSGPDVPPADNPGVTLGISMAKLAQTGRDKVTLIASPGIAGFGAWLEQLLAESTGKLGKGLVPIDVEPLGPPDVYGQDRVFVYMRLTREAEPEQDNDVAALERAGHPIVRIAVADRYNIGQEFFRWQMATAVAGAILQLNPFNQPDVEASKSKTRELTAAYEKSGKLPAESPFFVDHGIKVFAPKTDAQVFEDTDTLAGCLKTHFDTLRVGDYCGLLAYIERNKLHADALQDMRLMLRDRKRVATCVGFGPRFLHSTGQAYKGGPNNGVFLQITCDDASDLQVPGQKSTFGVVKAAEARGDFEVLAERGRRVLRVHLPSDVSEGLATLNAAIREALA